jgi:methylmalonyl-CoA mutase
MLRATVETFTAVIGGANSIHTSTFDEPYNTSSQFSERIARNVQSILMDESHLHRVMDPSSGSWYIESLTKQLAEKTWEYIQTIEQKGGVLNALYEGFIQDEVKHTRNVRFDKINHRKERIVGTNMYPNINEVEVGLHEKIHLNQESVKRITPQDIKYTFSDEDFFQQLEDVIDRGALFQEVADGLLFEEKEQHIESIPFIRWSMKFEELRDHAKANYKKTGEEWSVQIINLGELVTHKPRTDFTKGFFEVGGFKLSESPSLLTVEELEFAIKKVDRHVFVICGSDQTYSEMGLTVTKLIKQHSPSATIFLAGKLSDDQLKDYQNAGLDDCVHINTNCYKFLLNLQSKMEGFHENA